MLYSTSEFITSLVFDKGSYDAMRASVDKVNRDELLKDEADVDCWMDEIANVIIEKVRKAKKSKERSIAQSKNPPKFFFFFRIC